MEERSPYARPLKRSNAVYSGGGSTRPTMEEIDDDLANTHGAEPAKDNKMDQNLSVKQLFLRYQGIAYMLMPSKRFDAIYIYIYILLLIIHISVNVLWARKILLISYSIPCVVHFWWCT